jgi:hypothetical protein
VCTIIFQGDDQVVLCTKDSKGYIYVRNMFVGVQTPQYISRNRPSYGLRNTDGYSNATHIVCKFDRKLSPHSDIPLENDGKNRDGIDKNKFVNLKEPHFMYPVYIDQDFDTPQGMFLRMYYKGISHRGLPQENLISNYVVKICTEKDLRSFGRKQIS